MALLNPKHYYTGPSIASRRHRVYNNLLGSVEFCPLVRKTPRLLAYQSQHLSLLAHEHTGAIHADVIARAAAFLLLQDSQASFAIEGEKPAKSRAERWGKAIAQAGQSPLSLEELLRLQRIVIDDTRFVKLGFRKEGGFIGMHDRFTAEPLPDYISARWEDLPSLLQGILDLDARLKKQEKSDIDAVVKAAMIAFGFVFIHPFADGNGRIHRYLIHHVLAEQGFTPKNIIFPVSAVILERISEYRQVLEAYSRPRLSFIDWRATEDGNVQVLNETKNLYRFFDATKQAEFLYACVAQTIEKVLPEEMLYLERYDRMKNAINTMMDMPERLVDLAICFLNQNAGIFSKRARSNEFQHLKDEEVQALERLYQNIWNI